MNETRNLAAVKVATDLLRDVNARLIEHREIRASVASGSKLTEEKAAEAAQSLAALLSAKAQVDAAIAEATPKLDTVVAISKAEFEGIAAKADDISALVAISDEIESAVENMAAIVAAPDAASAAQTAREGAETAQGLAETARDDAQTARDEAVTAVTSLGNTVALTQQAFDALDPPEQGVFYIIVPEGEPSALEGILSVPLGDLDSGDRKPGYLYIGTEAE